MNRPEVTLGKAAVVGMWVMGLGAMGLGVKGFRALDFG